MGAISSIFQTGYLKSERDNCFVPTKDKSRLISTTEILYVLERLTGHKTAHASKRQMGKIETSNGRVETGGKDLRSKKRREMLNALLTPLKNKGLGSLETLTYE